MKRVEYNYTVALNAEEIKMSFESRVEKTRTMK